MMLRLTLITTLACILLLQAQGNDDTPTEHSSSQLRGPVVTEVTAADEDQEILIVSFDSDSTEHPWTTINDPVMGGASTSTITVSSGLGVWEGEVRVVDSLGAPGFCTLRTGNLGDEQHFPDPTGTDYLTVRMEGASGLPVESFSAEISVSGVTDREHMYQAHLSDEYCCEMSCQVPWSVFQLSWRGQKIDGPPLSENLDKISSIGLGTSGTAGEFSLSINSFSGTVSELSCSEEVYDDVVVPNPNQLMENDNETH